MFEIFLQNIKYFNYSFRFSFSVVKIRDVEIVNGMVVFIIVNWDKVFFLLYEFQLLYVLL